MKALLQNRLMVFALVGVLLVGLSACGGLAGQAEIVATLTPLPTSAPMGDDSGYPKTAPNLVRGAQIFQEKCTACHGEAGDGNGQLVQSGQVGAMPSFLDVAYVRGKRPDEFWDTITNGNLEKLMPPWKDALTVQERWDVALYVYTLHYSAETVALGQQLYTQNCQECHGTTGQGDGEKQRLLGSEAYDLTYFPDMIYVGDQSIVNTIKKGKGDAMPSLDGKLSDDEMWAIAEYIRSFSTSTDEAPSPATTEDPNSTVSGTVVLSGTVNNGTADGIVPLDVVVNLRFGNAQDGIQNLQTPLQADGTYTFSEVPLKTDYGYLAFVTYQNQIFTSAVLDVPTLQTTTTLPITLYELTEDPYVISLKSINTQIEPFPDLQDKSLGHGLLITQTLTYFNSSDHTFILSKNGTNFSLLVQFPPGSIILSATQDPRYIVAQQQYAVIDTQPVNPGDHVVEVSYFLPYEDGAIFDQPLSNPFKGTASVVISPKAVKVVTEGWTLDDSAPFVNQYSRTVEIPSKDSLKFELKGKVTDLTSDNPTVVTGDILVPIIALVVIILAAGVLIYSQVRRRRNPDAEIQLLSRQIAELDTLHDKGQINHDAYQRQRQILKTRLTTLMTSNSKTKNIP